MIHLHKWGMWELTDVDYHDSTGRYTRTVSMQERRCKTCGKYQLRKLK